MYVWGKKGIDWDTVEVCMCLKGGKWGVRMQMGRLGEGKGTQVEGVRGKGGKRLGWQVWLPMERGVTYNAM